jgi:hypothetical protein
MNEQVLDEAKDALCGLWCNHDDLKLSKCSAEHPDISP